LIALRRSSEALKRSCVFNARYPCRSNYLKLAEVLTDPFQLPGLAGNKKEDGSADESEAAVDEAPVERDAADGTGDEGKKEDADARDEAPRDDPLVADGVEVRADERDGDDDVGEASQSVP